MTLMEIEARHRGAMAYLDPRRAQAAWGLALIWTAALILLFFMGGCAKLAPEPNFTCNPGDAVCHGKAGALVCVAGVYVATTCGGPQGCVRGTDRHVLCDQSAGAKKDEPCLSSYDGQAQCEDGSVSAYLVCSSGVWTEGQCASACKPSGATMKCQ